ncbi:putative PKS-like protein biosynthetic cluster [Curvularia kusanoi]|uniref:PKS-like protein biosynthetic cluster n=1 Tax=Curvularia kusanoi TaxID=90978 RepID=A0A9P4TM71_CURKU|nr:putative PKS-like protein biosynthetic cluster [Curvularia kusanoi]
MSTPHAADDIGIIGLSFRHPTDVSSDDSFWDMLQAGRSASGEVPNERFSLDRYWHPSADRHGACTTKKAYFLHRDVAAFDAPFFSMTSTEAAATDPQHRMLLETSYEALENAGISTRSIIGSDCGSFIGGFGDEYRSIQAAQVYDQNQYQAVGTGGAMLSNRLSWFYDLRGPSFSLDTACSSSMVALHLACQSLKLGECSMALVGGVNMLLGADTFVSLSRLRFLSPDGVCHTFDDRANGYARGEGVGILVIKKLSDALRDQDTIRAVIRGTHINQDGKTPSITVPSAGAQASLIRETYRKAGLDLAGTGYFEAHGTGTAQGDFQEMSAIADVFQHRGSENALFVGSVKTNVGHGEGLAGINGLIKSVLMLERGYIPPLAGFERLNPRLRLDDWNLKLPLELTKWPHTGARRVSINSFGYGGTNGHAIVDDAFNYLKDRGLHGNHRTVDLAAQAPGQVTLSDTSVDGATWPQILVFSSPEQSGVQRLGKAYQAALSTTIGAGDEIKHDSSPSALPKAALLDLAYTLSQRRTQFEWRSFVIARSKDDAASALTNDLVKYKRSKNKAASAFIFTGQGAQWPTMGYELFAVPIFKCAIQRADTHLSSLGCTWSALEEIKKSKELTNIDKPAFSQPLCTIVQLAIIDLLASWGLKPAAVVGHSSGEIAAAYASGALAFEDACTIAYFRGLFSADIPMTHPELRGTMLATALSEEDALRVIETVKNGRAGVACVNSPNNVTISGDMTAITEIEAALSAQGTWARRLRVDVAYHSHHMHVIAQQYLQSIEHIKTQSGDPNTIMFSSVTGEAVSASHLGPKYWVENLLNKVNFSKAVSGLLSAITSKKRRQKTLTHVSSFVEIGPHSALQGPLRQIMVGNGRDHDSMIPYVSILRRNEDAAITALEAAATVWTTGVDVKLDVVNTLGGQQSRQVLTDLPRYPWNHSRSYWHEARKSRNHRLKGSPRTDMLGALSTESSLNEPRWTNILRPSAFPWILDHKMQGTILLPAACMLAMAIEAAQFLSDRSKKLTAVELKEVMFSQALVFYNEDTAIETSFEMKPHRPGTRSQESNGMQFRFVSFDPEQNATEHCTGILHYIYKTPANAVDAVDEFNVSWNSHVAHHKRMLREMTISLDAAEMYSDVLSKGLEFGPMFQNLTNIQCDPNTACLSIEVPDTASTMPGNFEYPAVMHPVVIDAMFQSLLPATRVTQDLTTAGVPHRFNRMWVSMEGPTHNPGTVLDAHTTAYKQGQKNTIGHVVVAADAWTRPVAILDDFVAARVSMSKSTTEKAPAMVSQSHWVEDLTFPVNSMPVFLEQALDRARSAVHRKIASARYASLEASTKLGHKTIHAIESHLEHDHSKASKLRRRRHGASNLKNKALKALGKTSKLKEGAYDEAAVGEVEVEDSETNLLLLRLEDALSAVEDGRSAAELLFGVDGAGRAYLDRALPYEVMAPAAQSWMMRAGDKNPDQRILHITKDSLTLAEAAVRQLRGSWKEPVRTASYTICSLDGECHNLEDELSATPFVHTARIDLASGKFEGDAINHKFDLVLWEVDSCDQTIATAVTRAVRPLMQANGRFIVSAVTKPNPMVSHLMALKNGNTQNQCYLNEDQWEGVLCKSGFGGNDFIARDFNDYDLHQMSMLVSTVSTAVDMRKIGSQIILLLPQNPTAHVERLAERLKSMLNQAGMCTVRATNEPVTERSGKMFISLIDLNEGRTALYNMGLDEFDYIKALCLESVGLLWLTSGKVTTTVDPFTGIATGLVRTMVTENAHLKTCQLDMTPLEETTTDRAASTIFQVLERFFASSAILLDAEYAEFNGIVHVPRVSRNHTMSAVFANRGKANVPVIGDFYQPGRVLKLKMGEPGLLDTLHFDDHPDLDANTLLDPFDVEIAVEANGLNFMDVFGAMGNLPKIDLGTEAAGRITRVGSKVTLHKPGDLVFGLISSSMATHASTDEELVHAVPAHMSIEEAVACPTTYFTAYLALIEGARLRNNESVLIHAASGGLGQAAIQIAQHLGAEIYATVGTAAKKELLMQRYNIPEDHIFSSRTLTFAQGIKRMTKGRGVDVVVNSLSGDALQQSFKAIGNFGRFVEVGKRDAYNNTGLEMSTFLQHVSFHFINLEIVALAEDRERYIDIARGVWKMLDSGVFKSAHPLMVFPYCDVEQAFRLMQSGKHTGKLVLRARADEKVPVVPHSKHPLSLDPKATYMLVGGLGGIGRSITDLFVGCGARNVAFVSRSANDPKYQQYLDDLHAKGVDARTYACDITDEQDVAITLKLCSQQMPPIQGLVQCAMILRDTIFEKMTHEEWATGTRVKINGTWNLHTHAPKDMDFFIMLSSISGVIGNGGQANYNAGNVFQDNLAHYRRSQGLSGTSLNLGAVVDVGYLANDSLTDAKSDEYKAKVFKGVDALGILEADIHDMIKAAVTGYMNNETKTPPQLITGLGTGNTAPWMEQTRLSALRRTNDAAGNPGDGSSSQDEALETGMAEASTQEAAIKIVEDALVARIAKAISTSPEDIDVELPLYTYGVDSLIAVEIRNWTMTRLKSEVSIFDILSALPIKDLAVKMATGSQLLRIEARQQEHSERAGAWLKDRSLPAAYVDVPEEKHIKDAVDVAVQDVTLHAPHARDHHSVLLDKQAVETTLEVLPSPVSDLPPPSYHVAVLQG